MEVCTTLLQVIVKYSKKITGHIPKKAAVRFSVVAAAAAAFMIVRMTGDSGLIETGPDHTQPGWKVEAAETVQTEDIHAGFMGVMASAEMMEQYSQAASEINMAGQNEKILIGAARASRNEAMRHMLGRGTASAKNVAPYATRLIRNHQMPESEYYTLLRIVEAEATGEDLDGKMLIANVILNRVNSPHFPNSIEEVVWQQTDGLVQFQPTIDGRIYTVDVTDETIEAVDRVLAGEDHSQGALYFMARSASEEYSVGWFDSQLSLLFQHGAHEYYTLPSEA